LEHPLFEQGKFRAGPKEALGLGPVVRADVIIVVARIVHRIHGVILQSSRDYIRAGRRGRINLTDPNPVSYLRVP